MTVERFLSRLNGVKKTASGWGAKCPAHDDAIPSLRVAVGEKGEILLHCGAGCSAEAVVKALDLRLSDLNPEPKRRKPNAHRRMADASPELKPSMGEQHDGRDGVQDEDADDANPRDDNSKEKKRKTVATRLVEIAEGFPLFHDTQNRGFVRLPIAGHTEVWQISSTQFRRFLAHQYYRHRKATPNRNSLADAIATLEGKSQFECPEEPVFLRVAPYGDSILIDLGDAEWRVVKVTAESWSIEKDSPVAFFRTPSMKPLPIPAPASDGSLEPLWALSNVTPEQRPLVAGALINGFHPDGPYLVANYVGEQGTAKSCAAKMHRQLVDPNDTPLRSPPREERDLMVQAGNNWCVALDNLSRLPGWMSDSICRLATGGGHSSRLLYTNGEEFSLNLKRPVILNGIEDVATRPDLAERALQIEMERIPEERRISERELWRRFEDARPVIFSGLLNGMVRGLRDLQEIKLKALPRMADPVIFATAAEPAFGWERGTFLAAYRGNLEEGAIASIDAHPVGRAVERLLTERLEWFGEPAELLVVLNETAPEELKKARNWPQNPRALSSHLRRLAQALPAAGIHFESHKGKRRKISLRIDPKFASAPSPASPEGPSDDASDAKFPTEHDVASEPVGLVEEEI